MLDAFFITITMTCKFKEKDETNLFVDGLMENDVIIGVELNLLASNIKKKVFGFFYAFLSFLKKFVEQKTHNLLALMLNPKYKNLKIFSTFVGKDWCWCCRGL